MSVRLPVCWRHQDVWDRRDPCAWIEVGVYGVVLIACAAAAFALFTREDSGLAWDTGLVLAGAAGLVVTALIAMALHAPVSRLLAAWFGPVRAREVTQEDITLTGVAPKFVEALQEERHARGKW
jgi:hypothetical protein